MELLKQNKAQKIENENDSNSFLTNKAKNTFNKFNEDNINMKK